MKKHKMPNKVYSIWDNKTDELLILDGDASACAARMGLTLGSFGTWVTRMRRRADARYTIETRRVQEGDIVLKGGAQI